VGATQKEETMVTLTREDAGKNLGWKALGTGFANAFSPSQPLPGTIPGGAAWALMSVRDGTVTLTFDSSTPSNTNGHNYGASGTPYILPLDATELAKIRITATTGTSVAVTYMGRK